MLPGVHALVLLRPRLLAVDRLNPSHVVRMDEEDEGLARFLPPDFRLRDDHAVAGGGEAAVAEDLEEVADVDLK